MVLTPEVKQAIADEVRAQIAAEQAAARLIASRTGDSVQHELPGSTGSKERTFVVSNTLAEQTDATARHVRYLGRRSDANRKYAGREPKCEGDGDQRPERRLRNRNADVDGRTGPAGHAQRLPPKTRHGDAIAGGQSGQERNAQRPAPDKTAVPDGTAQPDPDAASQIEQTDQDAVKAEEEVQQSQQGGGND